MLKKPIKKSPVKVNQSELKQTYDLVVKDLFSALKKAKDGAKVKLGDLGSFEKKLARITSLRGSLFGITE
jgi:hypothetical protein